MDTMFGLLISGILACVVCFGIYSSIIERFWFRIQHVRIPIVRLPKPFSQFRIVLISDIHMGFFFSQKHFRSVVEEINKLHPDMICFAGDLLDSDSCVASMGSTIPLLRKLAAPYGKFAILGNHDYRAGIQHVVSGLEKGGFRVLINEHTVIQKDAEVMFIVGLDDILKGKPNPEQAFEGIPEDACTLLLVHEPDFADVSKKLPIQLQLSGHSHGGQVRIPFIGPIVTTKFGRKYVSNLYHFDSFKLYTSRGIGTTGLPVRFCCRPEITVITLEQNSEIVTYIK
ncbi:metallophosphoesterase [Fodinisporobacter ferrooxydans]|uniref:Metallophosphoesterase n=1 Tax=Fodinisporobacter ferrooxydans TaxID=2901836 RepID=A0ABY4CK97_9BACL|nr:metallophosphoesterase [Alicyclobacillaceae bacterium MYW30-H2]